MPLAPLKVGMLGLSIDIINQGEWGYVYLPLGPRDSTVAGGREWIRVKVRALESIRAERDIIIANAQGEVKEHTPVELSYQTVEGPYQRVTEAYPLPITEGYKYGDYTAISFTTSETSYVIGTDARAAQSTQLLFQAKSLLLYATQDCLVRFDGSSSLQHFVPNGVYITFPKRCSTLYIVRSTADGTLRLWAFG